MQTVFRRSKWLAGLLLLVAARLDTTQAQSVDAIELLPPIGSSDVTDNIPAEAVAVPPTPASSGWPVVVPEWISGAVWQYGAELGINGSAGNAQAFSVLAGANAKRETEGNVLDWNLKYGKTQTQGLETQHFALMNSRWDWKYSPIRFLYNKSFLEYDEFKAFDIRLVLSAGIGHHVIKTEATTLTGRFGAGTSREFGGPDNTWVPEANVGLDFERQLTARQRVKLTSDYYPSWEEYRDYRLVTDAFWEIQLDEEANLSVKVGAIDRYDSTPNGLKHNDVDYFATLIWKK